MNESASQSTVDTATRLLNLACQGDDDAVQALLPVVYEELRARAGAYFGGQPANHTLQPTALVHEAYLRLVRSPSAGWKNRAHFCAVAATAMRQILINHANRRALAQKARKDLHTTTLMRTPSQSGQVDVLSLDEALKKLAVLNPGQARLVELRFFGGLTVEEVAEVLDISVTTARREWRNVRAWLLFELNGRGEL